MHTLFCLPRSVRYSIAVGAMSVCARLCVCVDRIDPQTKHDFETTLNAWATQLDHHHHHHHHLINGIFPECPGRKHGTETTAHPLQSSLRNGEYSGTHQGCLRTLDQCFDNISPKLVCSGRLASSILSAEN